MDRTLPSEGGPAPAPLRQALLAHAIHIDHDRREASEFGARQSASDEAYLRVGRVNWLTRIIHER